MFTVVVIPRDPWRARRGQSQVARLNTRFVNARSIHGLRADGRISPMQAQFLTSRKDS